MSKFSEHLDKCISNSGMTENQLAKMSGFNRSYIALMKNGQRVSPDTEKMVKLLDALALQLQILLERYAYSEIGGTLILI